MPNDDGNRSNAISSHDWAPKAMPTADSCCALTNGETPDIACVIAATQEGKKNG
jgi:hypothetical protein